MSARRLVPWLLVLVVAAAVLLATGTPTTAIAAYGLYWAVGVVLPGVLVLRWLWGSRGSWPEDVGLGAVVGLALELAFWAPATVLGLQGWLRWWPPLVLIAFALVPAGRRHWALPGPSTLPLAWSWWVATALTLAVLWLWRSYLAAWGLPPHDSSHYVDLHYHLSVVHELARSLPAQIPQVAGEPLRYHWFADAHMAAASWVSGVEVPLVLLRLWLLPLVATFALVGAALARQVSSAWWSGPVAAALLVVLRGVDLLPVSPPWGQTAMVEISPSQIYALPVALALACVLVPVLRAQRLGLGGWILLGALLALASGSKPTVLPMTIAATAGTSALLAVRRRPQWRGVAGAALVAAAMLPLSFATVVGSDKGSSITFADVVETLPLYGQLTGEPYQVAAGPLLPEGVADLSPRSLAVLALLLGGVVGGQLARLLPLAGVAHPRLRSDAVAWWLALAVGAGVGAFLVVSHPGVSQLYFLLAALPFASVVAAWVLVAVTPADRGRHAWFAGAAGVLVGAGVVAVARWTAPGVPAGSGSSIRAWVAATGGTLAAAALVSLAAAAGWHVASRRLPALRGLGATVLVSAVAIGSTVPATLSFGWSLVQDRHLERPASVPAGLTVRPDEAVALEWLRTRTPSDAIVATNVVCRDVPPGPTCDARSFRVSGLGGRRTVLEGWAYTNESMARGNVGTHYTLQPTPWPDRQALVHAAFSAPTPELLERLRDTYGVTWLYADRRNGDVSTELGLLAAEVYSVGDVTLYALP